MLCKEWFFGIVLSLFVLNVTLAAASSIEREHAALAKLMKSDAEAAECFSTLKEAADAALIERPNPIKK